MTDKKQTSNLTGAPVARAETASHKRDAQQDEAGPARTRML